LNPLNDFSNTPLFFKDTCGELLWREMGDVFPTPRVLFTSLF
jgi:hypothetical protein